MQKHHLALQGGVFLWVKTTTRCVWKQAWAWFAMGIDTQEQAEYWQAACKPDWDFTGRLIQCVNAIKQTERA